MTQISDRQYQLVAMADLSVETAATATIELPAGAMVVGGNYSVHEAATGTTPTLSMVDDADTPNTYLSAVAIGAAANGVLAAAEVGNFYPEGAVLSFSTGGTTPAGGRILVAVKYIVSGRGNEHFGS